MKRENLEKANEIDWSIREIETAIEKYNSNLADEVPMPIPGISRTSLSIPASRDVIKIIIADLEMQQHLLENKLLELE